MTYRPQSRFAAATAARLFSAFHPVRWLRQGLQSLAAVAAMIEATGDDTGSTDS